MARLPVLEIKKRPSRYSIYGPFTIFRSKKNGMPFLKTEVKKWRGINGCMIRVKNYQVIFLFRRRGLKK